MLQVAALRSPRPDTILRYSFVLLFNNPTLTASTTSQRAQGQCNTDAGCMPRMLAAPQARCSPIIWFRIRTLINLLAIQFDLGRRGSIGDLPLCLLHLLFCLLCDVEPEPTNKIGTCKYRSWAVGYNSSRLVEDLGFSGPAGVRNRATPSDGVGSERRSWAEGVESAFGVVHGRQERWRWVGERETVSVSGLLRETGESRSQTRRRRERRRLWGDREGWSRGCALLL